MELEHKLKIGLAIKKTLAIKRKNPDYDKKFRDKCGSHAKYDRKLSKEELYELYWIQKLALNKIAKMINADPTTIKNWLEFYKLGTRPLSESQKIRVMPKVFKCTLKTLAKGKRTGSFFNQIRPIILKRDNFCCVKCGSIDYLIVHHIKPLKSGGNHNFNNLQTLCRDCHYKIHTELRKE
jgi:5-methylcytosine-specific restriction protein A